MIREERLLKVLRAPHVSEKRLLRWKNPTPSYSKLLKTRPKRNQSCCAKLFEVEVESLTPR